MPFKVVLDANVLYPFTLRDTLLRAAARGLYQACWSAEILAEVARNLQAKANVTPEGAERLRFAMTEAFPEAMVEGYEVLVASMAVAESDRHVAAAAIRAGAQVVVTSNLKDFDGLPSGIEAQSPDDFLCGLSSLNQAAMLEIITQQAGDLKNPPRSVEDVVGALSKVVPSFASKIRASLSGRL